MNFSILSDFNDDDLNKMMDLGVKYSNIGSYAEPEEIGSASWSGVLSAVICVLELKSILSHTRIQPHGLVLWFWLPKLLCERKGMTQSFRCPMF